MQERGNTPPKSSCRSSPAKFVSEFRHCPGAPPLSHLFQKIIQYLCIARVFGLLLDILNHVRFTRIVRTWLPLTLGSNVTDVMWIRRNTMG